MKKLEQKSINAMKAIFDEMENIKPKSVLLLNSVDFFEHREKLKLEPNVNGEFYYKNIRIVYSPFAEKGIARELPISMFERPKVINLGDITIPTTYPLNYNPKIYELLRRR